MLVEIVFNHRPIFFKSSSILIKYTPIDLGLSKKSNVMKLNLLNLPIFVNYFYYQKVFFSWKLLKLFYCIFYCRLITVHVETNWTLLSYLRVFFRSSLLSQQLQIIIYVITSHVFWSFWCHDAHLLPWPLLDLLGWPYLFVDFKIVLELI